MGTISLSLPSDGSTIDAADVNTPFNTIAAVINGNLDNDNIATGANISGTKLGAGTTPLSVLDANAIGGWATTGVAVSSVTNNGNRSYDLTMASTMAAVLSPGMRLRTTRTVAAPTQCTDLEVGSSQYFSKTSPAGVTFTTTFTCMAWVKLESYTVGGIIARRNADTEGWSLRVLSDGTVSIAGLRIAANNKTVNSYASLPLGKWVHVAATMDMTVGDTSAQKIFINGVEVSRNYTLTGTATALVQGTTALVVGATKSAGTDPFDGKIAQAAVFSTQLTQANICAYMSQGLSGSETNLVSAYSLSNSLLDLSANDNDLSANGGALATDTDSPFGNQADGTISSTLDYGIVTKVATTTVTCQLPEGCTIPTSGGVTTLEYSTVSIPFGFPKAKSKWAIIAPLYNSTTSTTSTSFVTSNLALTLGVGAWDVSWVAMGYVDATTSNTLQGVYATLSTNASTETDSLLTDSLRMQIQGSIAGKIYYGNLFADRSIVNTAQTTHTLMYRTNSTSDVILVASTKVYIEATCAYL